MVSNTATVPLVGVLMGSHSDWDTMQECTKTLEQLGIPHEARVLSAHRTPDALLEYVVSAEQRGLQVLIAAAGGAAHLAGVVAAKTLLPVLGVPLAGAAAGGQPGGLAGGLDALLSMVQMPRGVPVGTLAVGKAGAVNAALLAAAILARSRADVRTKLEQYRRAQTEKLLQHPDPRHPPT